MSSAATTKAQLDGADMQPSTKSSSKPTIKVGSVSVPKLDLSHVAHGGRLRLHPNSARMLLSDEVTPQEKELITKGAGSWIRVLQPLLTKHVSETLVHEVTKICATVNLIPGQFLLKQGLHAKSIFIVVSGCFRLISLGVPGIEPLESSRATSARRSFSARQEAETFGSLIDPPKSSRPSPSFASEVPVFRVATIGPGQLIGEECFSTSRIIQFSVMSESYATVLSIPVDSLLPMLSNERRAALSTICLNTLACRVQRGATGGSWYLSRRTELQGFKSADPPMEMVGTSIQHAIKPSTSGNPISYEDIVPVNSSLPAYQIYSVDGQKFIQEQLMVCISASANSVLSPQLSTSNAAETCNLGKVAVSLHAEEYESPALRGHIALNPPTNGTTKPAQASSQPRAHHLRPARSSINSGTGQFVQPSQSQTGHSADVLLSRNSIIKKMYEQLEEAERHKQSRLQPKQGDQLSLKNALNLLGRPANVTAKKSLPATIPVESSTLPQKRSIIHAHLQKLFINSQPPPTFELASVAKGTSVSFGPHSAARHSSQSQESARSRPYNSNFSYLFEAKESNSHQFITNKGTASRDNASDPCIEWASNPWSLSTDASLPNSTSNTLKVQAPHPPASQASELSSATVTAKRRNYAVIPTTDFNPFKDADSALRSISSRPLSHKALVPNRMFFEKHAARSPRKFQPSSVALSDAKTELKDISESELTDLFIGSKVVKETLRSNSDPTIQKLDRHSVFFQADQIGPSLDRDLKHDENLNFSMSPWKSGA